VKLTPEQVEWVANKLNHHSAHVESHWMDTLADIEVYLDIDEDKVQEVLEMNEVKDKWNL